MAKVMLTPIDGTLPRLLTVEELQIYLRCSRPTAIKYGENCGAVRRMGRRILFDLETINRALESNETEQ